MDQLSSIPNIELGNRETPKYPYPERPGVGVESYIDILKTSPEIELTPEEKAEVMNFEETLTRGQSLTFERKGEDGSVEERSAEGLESIWSKTIEVTELYLEYFSTEEGKKSLRENFGFSGQVTEDNLTKFFSTYDFSSVDPQLLDQISGDSRKHMSNSLLSSFQKGNFEDVKNIRNPKKLEIIENPVVLAEKIMKLRDLKSYHKLIRRQLGLETSATAKAKSVILDIHVRRVNEMISELYSLFVLYRNQYKASGEVDKELYRVIEENFYGMNVDDSSTQTSTLKKLARLDRFSEGAGEIVKNGNFGPLSTEALEVATGKVSQVKIEGTKPDLSSEISQFISDSLSPDSADKLLTELGKLKEVLPDELLGKDMLSALIEKYGEEAGSKLREIVINTTFNAAEMENFLKTILNKYGLLSNIDTVYDHETHETYEIDPDNNEKTKYDPNRSTRASDGKWQVIISPTAKVLSVNSKKGIMTIPENLSRKLGSTKPAGVLAVSDHEVMHVLQHENKSRMGLSIMEKVGTDRSSVNAEAGALSWERAAKRKYFDQNFSISKGFLTAVQERMKGRSFKACVKAFYDNSLIGQVNITDESKLSLMREAIKQTERIFGTGSKLGNWSSHVTDSEPLVYLEQNLIAEKLSQAGATDLLAIGGVSLQTLADLHKIGLYDPENIVMPDERPSQIILAKVKEKLLSVIQEQIS